MKVVILGAGIIGVSTAWYLAQAGHEVEVLEREDSVGLGTSFANAGQLSFGYSTPWAAPHMLQKAIKWMLGPHSPLIIRPDGTLYQLNWLAAMYANCNEKRYEINKERMVRVAEYSRACFKALRQELTLHYDGLQKGTLQVFRTQKQLDQLDQDTKVLRECGVPYEIMDPDACVRTEPALALTRHKLTGGLWLPEDETGDCHLFTQALARECEKLGVRFHYRQHISGLMANGSAITAVKSSGQLWSADHFVCALGSFSRDLLLALGLDLPVYPVKGYSITLPVRDADFAPQSTVMDETNKVAVTRLGDRIRVGGTAELSGYEIHLHPKRRDTLTMVVEDLFPQGSDTQAATFWSGLRPMTPDGTPIIGATPYRNLTLNTGHGTLGWTMSLGSGKLAADLISGRQTDIRSDDLALARYA